jgi:predicted glutamine amidotransferase
LCRFLAYRGDPVFLEDLICAPSHSLVHQSLHAEEAKSVTNGDGFGVGWYGARAEPGLYREIRPAWADENLRSLCSQVHSGMFLAHVRASTGTSTTRANCHPFAHGKHLFMHNGQIGGWARIRRKVEDMIPDALYESRGGTTDSEAIFLAALAHGIETDPIGAMARTLKAIRRLMDEAAIHEPLRFTAMLSDGENIHAVRWACDAKPPSLYWREDATGLVIVSEPLDGHRDDWKAVPEGCALTAGPKGVVLDCMNSAVLRAA